MTLSLADALTQAQRTPGTPCAVFRLLEHLEGTNPDLAAELRAELHGAAPVAALARATVFLADQGVIPDALSQNSIGRHRRRECRCP
jgi:hypothetical protein